MNHAVSDAHNVAAWLWRVAEARPGATALVDGGGELTFDQFRERAMAVVQSLWNRGVLPGDRVALLAERSMDAAAAIFGIWVSGAVGVCVNDRLRPRQIEHMLRNSGARALLTTADMLARNSRPLETEAEIIDLATATVRSSRAFAPIARSDDDVAQIVYTSGSTGLPKGVAFTHGGLRTAIEIVADYLGLGSWDRIASLLPFSSVYGLNQLLCAVRSEACLIIETSPLPAHIIGAMRDARVSVAAAVPPLWMQLLSVPDFRRPVPSLRLLQNAGGYLPREITRQLRAFQPEAQLVLQYGMTETFRSAFLPPREVDRRPDSMGRAMPRTEIYVVRDDLTLCEPNEVGELVHRGPTIAAGYWNDPVATAQVFRPNPFAKPGDRPNERVVFSGDLVRRDAAGFLYYVARRDRVIKTLGFRVGPDEIADVLFASGQIDECVVTTTPHADRGEEIVAFVVLAAGGSLDTLMQFSRLELPRHMQPGRVESVGALPRLASGKYDVTALRESQIAQLSSSPASPAR
jgi:acyl-CoA synthetase (AMP-forming)/AMP-acid ligase II